jgi:putative ABC transport system permease protein
MSAVAHPSASGGPRDGGVAARRAVIRWAWRMFRREWRQQLLVVTLLTVAVAAAVGGITIAYNAAQADDAEVGSANRLLKFDGTDQRKLEASLASARRWFGTIDAIPHRSVAVPGSVESVDFRAQDPRGPYGGGLLALRRGSYPTTAGQVAVTDGVAKALGLEIGSTLALDGRRRTVVGIVENPRKLSDEFALVSPGSLGAPDYVTVLVRASSSSIDSFTGVSGASEGLNVATGSLRGVMRPPNNQRNTTLAMFSVTTVFLLLASLVAAAGFAVVAQRRLRQLGMLAAVGATQKQVRLVLVANGVLVGVIAALCGTIVGLGVWLGTAPTVESAVDHRIDRFTLPWPLIIVAVLLAVAGAATAAWWPGRAAARLPVMLALSGRPARPRPARHSAIAAVVLIVLGIGFLALSNRDRGPLIVAGIVATILGTLLLGPLAIRTFSAVAGRVPIAPRLALRDLIRYQARSGAALAAVTLALGIAAAVVVVASAEGAKRNAEPVTTNLTDRQIRVYLGPPETREAVPTQTVTQLDRLAESVRRLAARLDRATVTPLRKVVESTDATLLEPFAGTRVFATIEVSRTADGKRFLPEGQTYVATPAVLEYLGIDPATVDPGTDFLVDRSVPTDGRVIPSSMSETKVSAVTNVQRIDVGERLLGSAGIPSWESPRKLTFITLGGLRRYGWKQVPAGWLVESSRPLTSDQIAAARDAAGEAGLSIQVRRGQTTFARMMAIATAAGALLALAILAMTVGLIRGESAGDLRTLTATGATSSIRRTLTATTAGALALLGALLGVAGAYLVLLATYRDDLGYLGDVPVFYLALAVVGVPLAAAAAGWLVAGREPPAIARPVIQ